MRLRSRFPRAVRTGTVALGGCAAVAIGVAPALARSQRVATTAASCTPKHKHVSTKNARVIVYAKPTGTDPYSGGQLTTYYACLRPEGRPVTIGQRASGGGEYPGNVEIQDIRIAGTFAADESADGFASAAGCGKYEPGPACSNIVKYWVKIANVRARRTMKVPLPGPVTALALSPTGDAAWVVSTLASNSSAASATLYAIVVHPAGPGSLSGTPAVIDTGSTITEVSFHGSTLQWSNAGQPKSQTIS